MIKRKKVYCRDCKYLKAYNAIGDYDCRKVRTTWDTPLEEEWSWGNALRISCNNKRKMFEPKDEDEEESDR